jgi:magnesium chelatase subunit I
VINELPDLQARIQVALFNILQEGDMQIRGFKLRLPLDIQFVFTANPEDYTNRGSIVTPLKDRIDSQILTHYPSSIEISGTITAQEAKVHAEQKDAVVVDPLIAELVERIAFEARRNELIDQKSGVSARLTISALESLYSAAERRSLINGSKVTEARLSDLYAVLPAITGKVELVYEGELEGPANVAHMLIGKAIRAQFRELFPDPEKSKKSKQPNPYAEVLMWFNEGNTVELGPSDSSAQFMAKLESVPGLKNIVKLSKSSASKAVQMELILHGLAEFSQLSKEPLQNGLKFTDLMSGMLKEL